MSVDVRRADEDDLDRWDDWVAASPEGTVFHRRAALETFADRSGFELVPLVGFKGQEPVGVFPAFRRATGPVETVFSPAPGLRIPYLGPAFVNMGKLKARKAERRRTRLVDGCIEWLDDRYDPRYAHVRTSVAFGDARPFKWDDWKATPLYTYEVDLSPDPDDLIMEFSSDARSNVRSTPGAADIHVGDAGDVRRIVEQVRSRFEEQGETYELTADFAVELYERLDEGHVRPYVCRVDGEFVGGILALADDDRIYRWQGGVKTDVDLPVNDLLDWYVMRDAMDDGIRWYDLVGAEDRRISRYKSKWAPDLRVYYGVERGTRIMQLAANVYKRLK